MKTALAAFKFLTIVQFIGADETNPELIGKGAFYFPVVGLVFGLILTMLNSALEPYLASEVLAVFLVMALTVMSGAAHLHSAQKTFDSWSMAKTTVEGNRQTIGINGAIALLLIVLFKVRSIEVAGEARHLSLLLTPLLARWSLVVFLYGTSQPADESIRLIAEHTRAWQHFLVTAMTLALAIFLVGRPGLWIALVVSLFTLLARSYLERRHGGLKRDHLGAVVELCETSTFIFFASF
jgi:adenosylcobinamide-GDP ribazoletransferase